jgi:hypothetical protein
MLSVFRALIASLALSACAAIVPSTAARLAGFDPLTVDPAAIELVVILPPGLSVNPGSARLELVAVRGDERREGSFRLADRPATLGSGVPSGASGRRFAIAEADIPRMRALQADIAVWKRTGDATGSLGLGIGGCAVGAGPAAEAQGSVLIRVTAEGPFLPLIDKARLADLLGAEVLAAIKPCKGAE